MRLRFLLDHTEELNESTALVQTLLGSPGIGIEFVERWQVKRITLAVLIPVTLSLIASLVYVGATKDVPTAFTVGCKSPM